MDTLDKLKVLEKEKCIYNIHYCKAGVGFTFYDETTVHDDTDPNWWKQGLKTHSYYPTFEEAVDAEYARLKEEKP